MAAGTDHRLLSEASLALAALEYAATKDHQRVGRNKRSALRLSVLTTAQCPLVIAPYDDAGANRDESGQSLVWHGRFTTR